MIPHNGINKLPSLFQQLGLIQLLGGNPKSDCGAANIAEVEIPSSARDADSETDNQ